MGKGFLNSLGRVMLIAGLVAFFCGACALRSINRDEFWSMCVMDSSLTLGVNDGPACASGDRHIICERFEAAMAGEFTSQAQCRDMCRETRQQLVREYLFQGCDSRIIGAEGLCRKYCNGLDE
ncbi:MAG: hypothetical protein D6E12_11885 [Desulfovibrio sp.]|nr:MAG: hypothetical protein D6E12_11885 [Desulfovibrio sp.]